MIIQTVKLIYPSKFLTKEDQNKSDLIKNSPQIKNNSNSSNRNRFMLQIVFHVVLFKQNKIQLKRKDFILGEIQIS